MKKLLDRIGKKIGLNLDYFLSRSLWVSSKFAVMSLVGLLVSVGFARLASKELLGQYQYVLSVVSLLSVLALPGINIAAIRAYTAGDRYALPRSVRIAFLCSLVASMLLAAYGITRIFQGDTAIGWSLILAGLFTPFFYAPNHWYVFYEGKLDFRSSSVRLIIQQIVLLISLSFALLLHVQLIGLVVTYFAINALFTAGFYVEAIRKLPKEKTQNQLSLSYAIQVTIQKLSGTAFESLQAIVIAAWFGFVNLAIFQIAYSIVNAFVGFSGTLASIYFPLLLRYKKLNYYVILLQHLALGFIFATAYWVGVKLLFIPIYGAAYTESAQLALALTLIVMILPLRVYLANFFTARDKNMIVIGSNLLASGFAITMLYVSRHQPFLPTAIVYTYTLNMTLLTLLLVIYIVYVRQIHLHEEEKIR